MDKNATPKNLLILGATGPTGIIGVRVALTRGHSVTVYARTPSKIPTDLSSDPKIKIIAGDLSPSDVTMKLFPVLSTVDAVVSFLGPNTFRQEGTPYLDFWRLFIPHIRSLPNPPYLVILSTISIASPLDSFALSGYLLVGVVRILASAVYAELIALKEFWDKEADGVEWTVFRVPILNDGPQIGEGGRAGYVGKGGWGAAVSKWDVATWAVREAEGMKWVGKMPAIFSGEEK